MCGDLPAGLIVFCPRKRHPPISQSRRDASKPFNLISIVEDIKDFAEASENYSEASLFSPVTIKRIKKSLALVLHIPCSYDTTDQGYCG
jgi:hypothetical protein